jgi:hypothetical protein
LGEVFVEDAQGAGADRAGCGSAEGAQAGGAGGIGGAVEEASGGGGMTAGVGKIARVQLGRGEIGQREDAGAAGGRWELVECCGERGPSRGVVTGSEVNMAGRCC